MKIFVANMNHIGDVLFSTPALSALQKGFPGAQISVWCGPNARPVLDANPHVFALHTRPRSWGEKMGLWREFRRQKFDLAVNFSSRSVELAFWARLSGAPIRWGHQNKRTRRFFTDTLPRPSQISTVEEHLNLALAAGGRENGRFPRLFLRPEEESWAAKEWGNAGLNGQKVIGLHVGASYAENSWRPEKLMEFSQIAAKNGARCLAFGGPDERETGAFLAQNSEILDWTGRHNLRQFFALVARSAAFVGGDSGPTHCAAALNVPTVGLYGFSNPQRTGVCGPKTRILGAGGNWDKKAQKKAASPHQWLDSIAPEMVAEALRELKVFEL